MKLKELPFKIGMQYENWEFDLELLTTKKSYEIYKYIKGDIISINNVSVDGIFLYFELDILFKVEVVLKERLIIT
ncbi:conserved hypothetical protein [Tenacibaculum maritimum]|uniref:hypothetical protein n=1 Tax=Tenacibaculum maritimum TaxID=107401 RepID=UPI0012E639ED|nr:hypothetical protein [Tenacibaculum maritimum]CAA0193460.1 conserved hypothetical protein [Tenacibaculum maritimum]